MDNMSVKRLITFVYTKKKGNWVDKKEGDVFIRNKKKGEEIKKNKMAV